MKNLFLTLMLVFSFGTFANENININFEEGNFFAITQQFDNSLLDNFTEKVLGYEDEELFIYFDTPGGSVIALSRMARIMTSSDIKFTCIVNFAASAGFMLFQHCDNRYILSDGVLMSHNWAGGFNDEAPRILTLFNVIQSLVTNIEAVAISKMNIDAKEYAALINNNLWMTLTLATKYDAIDGVISKITCDKKLISQRNPTKIRTGWFGQNTKIVYKSGCPLIQKTYTKTGNKKNDVYIETDTSLFEFAQKQYRPEMGNWIYMGKKTLE